VLSGIRQSSNVLQGYVGAAVDGEIGPQTIAATANADVPTLINQISDERIAHMQQSPVWSKYGKGWTARVQRSRAAALAMASAAAAQPKPVAPKPVAPTPSPIPVQPPAGANQMTPEQVAQVILSVITALAAQQGGQPTAITPTITNSIAQMLNGLLQAQRQSGSSQQLVLNQDTLQTLVAALAKQLPQGTPIQPANPASGSGGTIATPAPTTAGSGQSAISNPSVQIGALGLAISSFLQAIGTIAPPFSTALGSGVAGAASAATMPSPALGTLATVIPLIVAGVGATTGWGSLLGIASSLIGAIGTAAKKSQ